MVIVYTYIKALSIMRDRAHTKFEMVPLQLACHSFTTHQIGHMPTGRSATLGQFISHAIFDPTDESAILGKSGNWVDSVVRVALGLSPP